MANCSGKSDVTVLARVRLASDVDLNAGKYTVWHGSDGNDQGISLRTIAVSGTQRAHAYFYNVQFYFNMSGEIVTPGQWVDIAGVYSCTDQSVSVYLDGNISSNDTATSMGSTLDSATSLPFSKMGIGSHASGGNAWKGDIAFVRVFEGAMAASEIDSCFDTGASSYPLLYNWDFSTAGDGTLDESVTSATVALPAGVGTRNAEGEF